MEKNLLDVDGSLQSSTKQMEALKDIKFDWLLKDTVKSMELIM